MSHVGLCPHFVHRYGGFKMQGRTAEDALKIVDNAKAIEEAEDRNGDRGHPLRGWQGGR